jgi:aminopeptidase N
MIYLIVGKIENHFINAFHHVLRAPCHDLLLLAELLILPSERYLAEQMPVIDVDAVHASREYLLKEISQQLTADFLTTYQQNNNLDSVGQFSMEEMAKRRLRNVSLSYLTRLPDQQYITLALEQFKLSLSRNMTDTIAAMRCLANIDCDERKWVINEFYNKWQHDPLVVDKWFSIQAESPLPDTLHQVKNLLQHPAFDIKNPNKVYALLAAFGFRNPVRFHALDGEGYALMADMVIKLDNLNPSVASRMVKPLTDWKRHDNKRQQLMRGQLEHILRNKKTSKDVYELASKSLE